MRVVAVVRGRETRQVAMAECRRSPRGRDVWGCQKCVKMNRGENKVSVRSCSGADTIVTKRKDPPEQVEPFWPLHKFRVTWQRGTASAELIRVQGGFRRQLAILKGTSLRLNNI